MIVCVEDYEQPQVCVRTSREATVEYPCYVLPDRLVHVVLGIFLVPGVGWIAASAMITRWGRKLRLPASAPTAAFFFGTEVLMTVCVIGGNSCAAYATYVSNWAMFVYATLTTAVGMILFWASDRFYIRTQLLSNKLACLERLHPSFLDALPPVDEASDEIRLEVFHAFPYGPPKGNQP
ncbi:MAG: hypothetical protein KDA60_19230 [Planctomycetales bacterium]|nr:hypothetical protein [Planctomycetales bacterium]